ncbi:hypothetical protein H8E88_15375 [candidate division KSB1 bacterium]|nr:hypothetical protein [candidate division KSB1 bacterium]MBL7095206.1 hypothetical protein [candidate division KSB1 bacterium]
MKTKGIQKEIKEKVESIVSQFNEKTFKKNDCYYVARFNGKFLYLDRNDYGKIGPICRLTYNGKMNDWDFAIFKWSREIYDPDEWMFPGAKHIDGTVEGAMKAGLEAYPLSEGFGDLLSNMSKIFGFK